MYKYGTQRLTNKRIRIAHSRFTIAITIVGRATIASAGRGPGRHVVIGTAGALLESVHKCLYNKLDGQFINSLHVLCVAIS